MNDTLTISSTNNASISHVLWGFPQLISPSVRNVTAFDSQSGKKLPISLSASAGNNVTAYEISLPNVKAPPGAYKFVVQTILTHLVRYIGSRSQFNFTFNPFPWTNFEVQRASVLVNSKSWSSPTASSNLSSGNFTNGVFTIQNADVLPFNTVVGSIAFSATQSQNNFDAYLQRTLTIQPSGAVSVNDEYNLTNKGPSLASVVFTLPKDVQTVSGSDAIGILDVCGSAQTCVSSAGQSNTNSTWKVSPRYGSLGTNQSMVVDLHYDLPSSLVTSSSPGTFNLNYPILSNAQFYQSTFQTRIVAPAGFRLVSSSLPYSLTGNQYVYQFSPMTPFSSVSLSLSYSLGPFWASVSPLAWTVLLELALVFVVLLVLQPGTRALLVAGGPVEAIRRYVDLNDEKSTLRQEADRMEEDMNRGAINRHEYKRRRRLIDIRMAEIDRSLGSVKTQLSSAGARYQEMVRRVERAEVDLQTVRTSMADLRNQYRSGRIEKSLYESLLSDLERRRIRDRQTIDNVIITLREEVR